MGYLFCWINFIFFFSFCFLKVPIRLHGVEGRYATALFTVASQKGSLDKVEKELEQVADVIHKDKKIKDFFGSPLNSHETKLKGVWFSSFLFLKRRNSNKNDLFYIWIDGSLGPKIQTWWNLN